MKNIVHKKRTQRVRRKLKKVSTDRYRLAVFRSSRNISAQIIDDLNNKTLITATSDQKNKESKKKKELSDYVANILVKKALEKKITKVYFDRGSYKYHGRVKALAEALRKGGLNF
jgi:large subunit ribosomal protein L18